MQMIKNYNTFRNLFKYYNITNQLTFFYPKSFFDCIIRQFQIFIINQLSKIYNMGKLNLCNFISINHTFVVLIKLCKSLG